MNKPYKYTIIGISDRSIEDTNIKPSLRELQQYVYKGDNTWELQQVKTCYIDTRYEAKLRLYNYITYTRNGLEIPMFKPFEGTEIGKSLPILNF